MTQKAPERIWGYWDDQYDFGTFNKHGDPRYTPSHAEEYLHKDHALALVAAAYEDAAKCVEGFRGGVYHPEDIAAGIRARTNADAQAALERVKQEARNEALREAATICNRSYGGSIGDVHKAILALITEDQSDDG